MEITTHPLFALYVMWHPSYPGGRQIADEIRMRFSRNLYRAVEEPSLPTSLRHRPPLELL